MFDLTSHLSFQGLRHWLEDLGAYAPDKCPKLLLGNKSDLASQRQVSREEAQQLARDLNLMYFEVSSKEDEAEVLEEILRGLAGQVVRVRAGQEDHKLKLLPADKKSSCCT